MTGYASSASSRGRSPLHSKRRTGKSISSWAGISTGRSVPNLQTRWYSTMGRTRCASASKHCLRQPTSKIFGRSLRRVPPCLAWRRFIRIPPPEAVPEATEIVPEPDNPDVNIEIVNEAVLDGPCRWSPVRPVEILVRLPGGRNRTRQGGACGFNRFDITGDTSIPLFYRQNVDALVSWFESS